MANSKHPALTTKQIVALVEMGEDRLAQIEQAGFIKRAGRNTWPAIETLAGLVQFYRDENRRGPKSAADAQWRAARAREIEIRIAEREHKLIPVEELNIAWDFCLGTLVSNLSSVPARCTRDLVLRHTIEHEIDLARNAAADVYGKQAELLAKNGKAAPMR